MLANYSTLKNGKKMLNEWKKRGRTERMRVVVTKKTRA